MATLAGSEGRDAGTSSRVFLRARLGSALAIAPLGVWTFVHLWHNLAAFEGAAEWERAGGGRGGASQPQGGSLKVVTTNMRGGWLRKNGVPYSENAVLTEYFDRFADPTGAEWLVVTSTVSDPKYLTADFVTSSHFRKEPDRSKFAPVACR